MASHEAGYIQREEVVEIKPPKKQKGHDCKRYPKKVMI